MREARLCATILAGVLCYAALTVSSAANELEPSEEQLEKAGLTEGAIEPERLSALMSRALDAANLVLKARNAKTESHSSDNLLRIDAATKAAAADLRMLRNYLLANGLPGAERSIQWPQWISEPPTDKTPLDVLRQRLDWLGENVMPMTDAVCDLASKQTGDTLVCSVE